MYFFLKLLFCSLVALAAQSPEGDQPWVPKATLQKSDCTAYEEAWRIAMCASSQRSTSVITDEVFAHYLQVALAKIPSGSAYTSIGFTTGVEKNLVVGKQSHFDFDIWGFKLSYDPRNYYHEQVILATRKIYTKPVLLFVPQVPSDIPSWRENLFSFLVPAGGGKSLRLFRGAGASSFTATRAPDCSEFYDWEQRESVEKKEGVAIIMDASLWCPQIQDSRFEIVVAELKETKATTGTRLLETKWEITKDDSKGTVPTEFKSVF